MARRQAIYEFIVKFKREHDGNGPTVRQIAAAIGDDTGPISTSVVQFHLKKLKEAGRIVRGEGGIEIVGAVWLKPGWVEYVTLEEELL